MAAHRLTLEQKLRCSAFSAHLGRLGLVEVQAQFRNTGCDIQAVLTLNRDWLQRYGILESANQDVGARTDSHRRASRGPGIMTRKCTLANISGRRQHCPDHDCGREVSD